MNPSITTIMNFPMPGETLSREYIVVASSWRNEEDSPTATVLLLANETPFYRVGEVTVDYDQTILWLNEHENIVPAVHDYEQNGGDF